MTAPEVFAPARLGPVELRNRVIKAATFEGRTPRGLVTDELIDFHLRPARGGVGMTTVAYCAVSPEGRTDRHQIWMRAEAVPGLRRLTDAVHAEGAAVSAQLGHAGPVANPASNRLPALGPTRRLTPLGLRMIRAASGDDLRRIIRAHAEAARTARDAGFDAVEVHLGHNYLVSSFLSARLNRRTDEFGGSLANRARLARDVARAVRDAVGSQLAIIAKLNMDDGVPGGFWLDESIQVGAWLEADGSVDALELTAGSSLLNPMYLFTGDAPVREFAAQFPPPARLAIQLAGGRFLRSYPYQEAYLLDRARQFRAALKLPLILLGGITRKETMDTAMAEGFAFVALARALLREPGLLQRIQADPQARSLCVHCNKCMPTIYTGTRCVLVPPAPDRRPLRSADFGVLAAVQPHDVGVVAALRLRDVGVRVGVLAAVQLHDPEAALGDQLAQAVHPGHARERDSYPGGEDRPAEHREPADDVSQHHHDHSGQQGHRHRRHQQQREQRQGDHGLGRPARRLLLVPTGHHAHLSKPRATRYVVSPIVNAPPGQDHPVTRSGQESRSARVTPELALPQMAGHTPSLGRRNGAGECLRRIPRPSPAASAPRSMPR